MTPTQTAALQKIRSAGTAGVDAWTMENGKRVRSFSPQVVAALIEAGTVEIAQDGRRPVCATYYRVKSA